MAAASPAWAQNPFNLDGNIPDGGAMQFMDPSGSLKELGPVNGNTTKIGVIHSAATPMLAFTNPNGQTDLVNIWLKTAQADDGDTWLYFAWQREASSGSSVITYEFQKEAFPADCEFDTGDVDFVEPASAGEADLIANCNPWSARANEDFLIVWDFQGGATDIILRTFNGTSFNSGETFANLARLSADSSRGEGALNLTEEIFDDSSCTSIASVITGTVTGNSDTADYKDTVFADVADTLTVSNCGTVIIRKETQPDGEAESFDFTHNLVFLPPTGGTTFSLSDDGDETHTNVVTPASDYMVQEDDPGSAWALIGIDCSESDASVNITETSTANRRVTFDLDRSETLDCTFTNALRPTVTVIKNVAVGDAAANDFGLTQDGNGVDSGESVTHDIGDTVVIDEGDVEGYEFVEITGHAKCPSVLGGSTSALAAGDNVTCTITNTLSPKVTLNKSLGSGDADLDSFGLTQNDNPVNSGQTVTYSVGNSVTINEAGLAGYEFVEITGDAECPDDLGGSIGPLAAGDDITCTIVNTLSPTVTLVKNVVGGDAQPNDFDLTQNGEDVDSDETITYAVGQMVTLNETQQDGYAFMNITGHAKCPDALGGATDALAGGDAITCTITNALQLGAIRIQKTRKFAGAETGDPADQPHENVLFTISGGSLTEPVEVYTDEFGEACLDNLPFSIVAGDYTVTETEPDGYVSDDAEQTVTMDQPGDCVEGNEEIVTFHNTPLTDVVLTVDAQDPDATRSRVNCYQATMDVDGIELGDALAENTTFTDDVVVNLDDLPPNYPDSLIVCTIEIDP